MNDFYKFIKYVLNSKLLIFGFIIYFSFNISAAWTHWFDFFFFGTSIHYCCIGVDFFQIPNAAYAFFHGGDFTGKLPEGIIQYSQNYGTNSNVYHPLLTILLGSFLFLFPPDFSINLWIIIKIILTLAVVYYIYKEFYGNNNLNLAIFLFLINFSQYNEIKISQFQFIFNIFLLLFLIGIVKNKNRIDTGTLYFFALIAKPIGLLWIPVLFFKKKITIIFTGLLLFLISTLTFNILGIGNYYINNIFYHLSNPAQSKAIDFLSLEALLRNSLGVSSETIRLTKIITLLLIYLISMSRHIHIFKLIFLLIVYFLFFYDFIFQYHFSVLAPILLLCLLVLPEFQTRIAKILMLIISLPNTFFIFRILNIGVVSHPIFGIDPTMGTWKIVSFFQILPILFLTIIVLFPDFKYYIKINFRKNVSW